MTEERRPTPEEIYGEAQPIAPWIGEWPEPVEDEEAASIYVQNQSDEWVPIATVSQLQPPRITAVILHEGEYAGRPICLGRTLDEDSRGVMINLSPEELPGYMLELVHSRGSVAEAFAAFYGGVAAVFSPWSDESSGVSAGTFADEPTKPYVPARRRMHQVTDGNLYHRAIPLEVVAELVNPKLALRDDEGIFQARRFCEVCGVYALVIAPISQVELYGSGVLAQEAFPDMAKEVREVIISGIHPECFPPEEPECECSANDGCATTNCPYCTEYGPDSCGFGVDDA